MSVGFHILNGLQKCLCTCSSDISILCEFAVAKADQDLRALLISSENGEVSTGGEAYSSLAEACRWHPISQIGTCECFCTCSNDVSALDKMVYEHKEMVIFATWPNQGFCAPLVA